MNNYLLHTNSLTKTFKNQTAVNNMNIHVKKGAIYGLLAVTVQVKTTL